MRQTPPCKWEKLNPIRSTSNRTGHLGKEHLMPDLDRLASKQWLVGSIGA